MSNETNKAASASLTPEERQRLRRRTERTSGLTAEELGVLTEGNDEVLKKFHDAATLSRGVDADHRLVSAEETEPTEDGGEWAGTLEVALGGADLELAHRVAEAQKPKNVAPPAQTEAISPLPDSGPRTDTIPANVAEAVPVKSKRKSKPKKPMAKCKTRKAKKRKK